VRVAPEGAIGGNAVPYDSQSGSDRDGPDPGDAGPDGPGRDLGTARWSGLGSRGYRGEPWFGQKRFGYGWGPRTWQGFLVTAAGLALVVVVGSATKGRSPLFYLVILLVAAVHVAIIVIQRRR
jgi:hypothetical protein